jgi:hypothetical protein
VQRADLDDNARVDEISEIERCAVCGELTADGRRYCRFYREEVRISCCSPDCAGRYLRGSHRSNGSWHGDLIAEMIEELRWTNGRNPTVNGHNGAADHPEWSGRL